MRLLESILNVMFSIIDCWQKTRDPFLSEYRSHARKVIIFSVESFFFLILATYIKPSNGGLEMFNIINQYISQGLAAVAMIFLLATALSCIAFYLFLLENRFWE